MRTGEEARTHCHGFLLHIDVLSRHQLLAHVLLVEPHELVLTHRVVTIQYRALFDLSCVRL